MNRPTPILSAMWLHRLVGRVTERSAISASSRSDRIFWRVDAATPSPSSSFRASSSGITRDHAPARAGSTPLLAQPVEDLRHEEAVRAREDREPHDVDALSTAACARSGRGSRRLGRRPEAASRAADGHLSAAFEWPFRGRLRHEHAQLRGPETPFGCSHVRAACSLSGRSPPAMSEMPWGPGTPRTRRAARRPIRPS